MEITTVVNSSESHTAVKEMNYNYMQQYVNIQIQSAHLILRMLVLYYKQITEKYTQYDFICIKFKAIKPHFYVKYNTFF